MVPEQLCQSVDRGGDEGVEIGAATQAGTQLSQQAGSKPGIRALNWSRRRDIGSSAGHQLDVQDTVYVCAAQSEHTLHALHRSHGGDVVPQELEDAASALSPFEGERKPVLAIVHRIHEHDTGLRILNQILGGLGEELVGQCDPLVVHQPHPRQEGDIWRAVCCGGGHDRRDSSFETQP